MVAKLQIAAGNQRINDIGEKQRACLVNHRFQSAVTGAKHDAGKIAVAIRSKKQRLVLKECYK